MPGTGKTVLVVDDIEANRYIVCRVLRDANYTTLEAETGVDAVEQARNCLPDAIVLDMNLPDQTGLTTLKKLRTETQTGSIPVVFLSATAQSSSDRQLAEAAGLLPICSVPWRRTRSSPSFKALLSAASVPRRSGRRSFAHGEIMPSQMFGESRTVHFAETFDYDLQLAAAPHKKSRLF